MTDRASGTDRAVVQGSDEVASLASSINRMLERLQLQHETLQSEARSQLHLLATCIAHLNDVVMITEPDPIIAKGIESLFVNEAFKRLHWLYQRGSDWTGPEAATGGRDRLCSVAPCGG